MVESRFAGVDWASEEHAVCVVDESGRIVEGRRFKHTEMGLRLESVLDRVGPAAWPANGSRPVNFAAVLAWLSQTWVRGVPFRAPRSLRNRPRWHRSAR